MLSELEIPGTRASVTSPVLDKLQDLLDELQDLDAGDVATYIPELGRADPDWFGVSVVTSDGHVFEVGDSRQAVHDPVDLQAVRVRHGARGARARSGDAPCRRRALGQRLQRGRGRREQSPVQSDGERRRDRDHRI